MAEEIAGADGRLAPVVADSEVTAEFASGKVSGSGGVNSYSAPYTTSGNDAIEIGDAAATLMAGPEPLMAQEAAYFKALGEAARYRVSADALELLNDKGDTLVRFSATEPVALRGTKWFCTGFNNGKEAVVGLVAGSEITAEFSEEGELSGSAGVNTYNTTFTTSGETEISISEPIATTLRAAADPAVEEQEAAYLAALPKAGYYRVSGDTLDLRESATGALLATYTAKAPK